MTSPAPLDAEQAVVDGPDGAPAPAERCGIPVFGESLGPYRLAFELASGGMASICVALSNQRVTAHRLVAVKRLHCHLAQDPNYRQMFLDEARIASQIHHPNVCAVLDYDVHDGTPYIVMEYLAGEPLSAILRAPRPFSRAETRRLACLVARIAADTCEALHAAHEVRSIHGEPMNVVHRDVSPENIFVTYDGVVKLCDFGIAIAECQEHQTEAGTLKGKYSYIQPEVLRGQRPDRRSDIWSLGVVLWELLTGERLFHRTSPLETLQAVGEALVPAPSAVVTDLPPELDAVVLRALSSDPDERFATAREFGNALNLAIASLERCVGLGEIAEWMGELFPDGRARMERRIELVGRLDEPTTPNPLRQSVDGASEALTLTIESCTTVPRVSTGRSIVAPSADGSGPAWRRSLTAFALGVVFSVGLLSPNRSGALDEKRAGPTNARATLSMIGALGAAPPEETPQWAPQRSIRVPVMLGDASFDREVMVDDSPICGGELEIVGGPSAEGVDPRALTLAPVADDGRSEAIPEVSQTVRERKRRTDRTSSLSAMAWRRQGSPAAQESFASSRFVSSRIPAMRPLELGPAFTIQASPRLLPLALLEVGRGGADEPPRPTVLLPSRQARLPAGKVAMADAWPATPR